MILFLLILSDLANPKGNTKTAGIMRGRDLGTLLSEGFVDTFRELYPDKEEAYSYWSYRSNARLHNYRDGEFVETCMSGSCDLFHHL